MSPALLALIFIVTGVIVFAIGIGYFAIVRGGWLSPAGFFATSIMLVGTYLVLVGFGIFPMPGLQAT